MRFLINLKNRESFPFSVYVGVRKRLQYLFSKGAAHVFLDGK